VNLDRDCKGSKIVFAIFGRSSFTALMHLLVINSAK